MNLHAKHIDLLPEQLSAEIRGLDQSNPGPILNFDLVYFSPFYTKQMYGLLSNSHSQSKSERYNLFTDWQHMSIKQELLTELQATVSESAFVGSSALDTQIVLVSEVCWRKITYIFG